MSKRVYPVKFIGVEDKVIDNPRLKVNPRWIKVSPRPCKFFVLIHMIEMVVVFAKIRKILRKPFFMLFFF